MPISRRRVSGAEGLQALGHPLRLALLELLGAEGPKTATQAASVLGESASNCSWHLRKLARHGFVRETRGATGRDRPWQLVTEALTWAEDEVAAEGVDDVLLERDIQRLRAARAATDEPEAWQGVSGVTRKQLWLTAEEARRLRDRIDSLLIGYDAPHHGARRVSAVAWVVPTAPHSDRLP